MHQLLQILNICGSYPWMLDCSKLAMLWLIRVCLCQTHLREIKLHSYNRLTGCSLMMQLIINHNCLVFWCLQVRTLLIHKFVTLKRLIARNPINIDWVITLLLDGRWLILVYIGFVKITLLLILNLRITLCSTLIDNI